jgi:transposase-like protein
MERRRFTREFKLEAVRLIRDRGVSYAQASQDLNVHPMQLRNWVKAFADDPQEAFPGQGRMKPEQWGRAAQAGSASARALNSRCDSGSTSSPIRFKWQAGFVKTASRASGSLATL